MVTGPEPCPAARILRERQQDSTATLDGMAPDYICASFPPRHSARRPFVMRFVANALLPTTCSVWAGRIMMESLSHCDLHCHAKDANLTAVWRRCMSEYRSFLALSYDELEEMNLKTKADRLNRVDPGKIQEARLKYLTDEKHIKAVTVMFSDLEGRIHLLDYDKKFLVKSYDNLTFDGSSIRGFTAQHESDLRLGIDWSAFYMVPADVFGTGKALVFGTVIDKGGEPYSGDMRGVLKRYSDKLYADKGWTLNAANEIEGFLFAGLDAEKNYHLNGKFEF